MSLFNDVYVIVSILAGIIGGVSFIFVMIDDDYRTLSMFGIPWFCILLCIGLGVFVYRSDKSRPVMNTTILKTIIVDDVLVAMDGSNVINVNSKFGVSGIKNKYEVIAVEKTNRSPGIIWTGDRKEFSLRIVK